MISAAEARALAQRMWYEPIIERAAREGRMSVTLDAEVSVVHKARRELIALGYTCTKVTATASPFSGGGTDGFMIVHWHEVGESE